MNMRQRMLAVIKGLPHDRVPFVQYNNMIPNENVWALLGRARVGIFKFSAVHKVVYPHCRLEQVDFERDGRKGRPPFCIHPLVPYTRNDYLSRRIRRHPSASISSKTPTTTKSCRPISATRCCSR